MKVINALIILRKLISLTVYLKGSAADTVCITSYGLSHMSRVSEQHLNIINAENHISPVSLFVLNQHGKPDCAQICEAGLCSITVCQCISLNLSSVLKLS